MYISMCMKISMYIDGVLKIQIDYEEIDWVYKTKFIGLFIGHETTWKERVTYVSGRMSNSIGILIKARNCVHDDFVLLIYIPLYDLLQ